MQHNRERLERFSFQHPAGYVFEPFEALGFQIFIGPAAPVAAAASAWKSRLEWIAVWPNEFIGMKKWKRVKPVMPYTFGGIL